MPTPPALPHLSARPAMSLTLSTGSRLEWRHFDSSQDITAVLEQIPVSPEHTPVMAVWPGHTLVVHEEGPCQVMLSLRERDSGGTTGSQSRLCARQTADVPNIESLRAPAELLHVHAEDHVTLSVWKLPMVLADARRWLHSALDASGWQSAPTQEAWTRSGSRLESFLTALDGDSGLASGVVLVRHDD